MHSNDQFSATLERLVNGNPTDADLDDYGNRFGTLLRDTLAARGRLENANYQETVNRFKKVAIHDVHSADEISRRIMLLYGVIWCYPEFILPLGFDEVRFACEDLGDDFISEDVKGALTEVMNEMGQPEWISQLLANITHYRSPNGTWHNIERILDLLTMPKPGETGRVRSVKEWLDLTKVRLVSPATSCPALGEKVVSLPNLWLPPSYGDSQLHSATKGIIQNITSMNCALAELHWRTLEELVAELLHDLGLQVTVTKRSADGGRDVIARGELIPGEPMSLAVEVKHRRIVPVSELRNAMWANRHFPALLFVTSGRFSAGVYRARTEPEGGLRLFLKDGVGLSQWITQYARRNFAS